jgi:prevent-host-death family protein
MATVNVHEAKTHFSKLLDRAHAGEEIILAKAGKPYAKLVPLEAPAAKPRRMPGRLKGIVPELPDSFFFDPLPEEELRLWEGR